MCRFTKPYDFLPIIKYYCIIDIEFCHKYTFHFSYLTIVGSVFYTFSHVLDTTADLS